MYYTGFADEAGDSIDIQIKATLELGWMNIESRNIDGKNIHDISDEKFEDVAEKLDRYSIQVNCFGSAVANWGKDPLKDEDFQASLEELKRAIPRMKKLGTKMIRGMSFTAPPVDQPIDPNLENIIIDKLKVLVGLCEDAGVLYLHENCMNYGGISYQHTLKLIEKINSDNFKLVFDTGNPVFIYNRVGDPPYLKQNSLDFYNEVKQHIHYVHIKDGIYLEESGKLFPEVKYTFPGKGDGHVKEIVKDLIKNDYDGGFSIEPHLSAVYHDGHVQSEADVKFDNYVEYGRKLMKLIDDIKK